MRRSRFVASLLFLLLGVQLAFGQSQTLSRRIGRILAAPGLSRGIWGIDAVSLTTGRTLYSLNADKLFTPASNAKLFTTAAGIALIGEGYRFLTTVETTAALDPSGRLAGDLVLVGRGDPNLSGRALPYHLRTQRPEAATHVLEDLADQLVEKGLKSVDGGVVADDSYYAFERYGEGWSQDDLTWEWGAPVSALSINDNVIFLSIKPGDGAGEHAFVSITPYAEYYRLENRILTTAAGTGRREIHIHREPGSDLLTLWGSIPADDSGANETLAVEDPAEFAAKLFCMLLEKRGVVVHGRSLAHHGEPAAAAASGSTVMTPAGGGEAPAVPDNEAPRVLAGYESQPLGEDLTVINKVSQNLHAELLLRLLGREKGASGSIAGGLEVVRGFLARAGLQPEEFVLYDGSGLSREDLVTPHAVVKLLAYASRQPWGAFYESTLPVGGVDGTLAERFQSGAGRERVRAKTGSLGHIHALSGYATTLKGDHIAFSILANNQNLPGKRAVDAIDAIVAAFLADQEGRTHGQAARTPARYR
jgi:D-alanyl-D-alanine carboxypeptidase/D-alanyl-D-alanine-endopeptidase (penicillin-binding protein 4)